MPDPLADAGDILAQDLLDVLELICPSPVLRNDAVAPQGLIRPIGGPPAEAGFMETTTDGIELKFFYRYDLDPDGGFLRVLGSSMGMSLTDTGRCLLRVEYDRNKGGDRSEAHVQVDADSALLGLALGRSGQSLRPMHALHIPAGGRRFRPTMEDFVEFLVSHHFVTPLRAEWRQVIGAKRAAWEERQAAAAARRHPDAAARELVRLGYSVTPPGQ